jgi:hypothetical protein
MNDAQPPLVWPHLATLPQRYGMNHHRYLAGGGKVRIEEDIKGFAGGLSLIHDAARFYMFCLILDQVVKEGLTGNVAELGVYKGHTATLLAKIARTLGSTAYLFDTFEGFDRSDLQGVDANKRMEFSDTSLEAVQSVVGEDSVRYVKGYFPASTSQIPDDLRFCVVHLDCDLYAPMKSALEYFYPRMVSGGFIVMHDYSSLHWDGAETAIDEFFADKPEAIMPMTDSGGSVAVRRARADYSNWIDKKKRMLLDQPWIGPENRGLSELIVAGWSEIEPWGVWGLGEAHFIKLYLSPNDGIVEIEADAQAVVRGERVKQIVDVLIGGEVIASWEFTPEKNHAPRSFTIDERNRGKDFSATVEFRPHFIESPRQLDPTIDDDRPLGLGISRLRKRPRAKAD